MTAPFVERRRPWIEPELLRRVAIAWVLIALLAIGTNIAGIAALRFPDPDDTLRLVQVRDLIAGQGWFDPAQHRVDAPHGGVEMHWSRLVDLPIAAVILLLRPLLGQDAAEMAALIGVPLITFAVAILLVGRIAWRMLGQEATTFACLALALSVPVVSQMRPLRIDHHGWQIVLALLAANGLMARSPRLGGWVIGLALAAWMAISIEGLPLAAAIIALVALRWLRRDTGRQWLVSTMQALAIGSIGLFLATRGPAALTNYCDAISPVHLAMFGWGALAITAMGAMRPHPLPVVLLGFGMIGAVALGIAFLAAPACLGGGFAGLDPLVREYWYDNVGEGLPVWQRSPDVLLQVVVPPLIGIAAAIALARRSRDWQRIWWIDYALLLAAALLVAILVNRAGAVAGALAAVPLGWQIGQWLGAMRRLEGTGKRAAALAAISLALVPALPVTLAALALPGRASVGGQTTRTSSCNIDLAMARLDALPPGEILAPLDIGPRLILDTRHSVYATGHHRGSQAMRLTIEAFLRPPDHALGLMRQRGTRYVAICPDLPEPALYARDAPDGLAARLLEGDAPAWLEPVAMPRRVGLRFWKLSGQPGVNASASPLMQ